jgi:hypothetical integral membrane protein (TIGR02206 family)
MSSEFQLFQGSHLIVLLVLFVGCLYFYFGRNNSGWNDLKKNFLGYGLIAQLLYFYSGHWFFGTFDFKSHLPLHLCSLSAYLVAITLLLPVSPKNKKLQKLVLFWSPVSALVAILLPDMSSNEGFPSFRFIEFFWSHILIIWGCVFILFSLRPVVKYAHIWLSLGVLVGCIPIIKTLNSLLGSNYMYLESRPNGGQMNFLPSEPYHILGLIAVFALVFHIQYFIYKLFGL